MLLPESFGMAMGLLFTNLCFWGFWPTLRELCGARMPSFALLNMTSQLLTSTILAASFGSSSIGNNDAAWSHFQRLMSGPDTRALAVVAGGFLLGHGDHLGSLAMQFIPAGVAYPLYAGISLVCGTCLNAIQVGLGSRPSLMILGLALVLVGLFFLALGHDIGNRHNKQRNRDTLIPTETPAISARRAMLICLLAGLCSGGWSPLSTYARASEDKNNPVNCAYITAFLFALGELCAYPSVAWLGTFLEKTRLSDSFRELTLKRVIFGLLCGCIINSGYVMYFLASTVILPTISFCITSCNPLLSLAIAFLRCQFKDAPKKQLLSLIFSVLCYSSAIAILAIAE